MATWYDMEGIARDEVPDGTPVPDGRWLDPMGGYYYQFGYPQPAPPPPPPQYVDIPYEGPPRPDEYNYSSEPSYYSDPGYDSNLFGYQPDIAPEYTAPPEVPPAPTPNMIQLYNLEGQPMEQIPEGTPVPSGRWTSPSGGAQWQGLTAPPPAPTYTPPPVPTPTTEPVQTMMGSSSQPSYTVGNQVLPNVTPSDPSTLQPGNMWLYNLEGVRMEQVPVGSAIPAGRWSSPTGGTQSANGGWGLPAGFTNTSGQTLPTGNPGDYTHGLMTAANNQLGGTYGPNTVTTTQQLASQFSPSQLQQFAQQMGLTTNLPNSFTAGGQNFLNNFGSAIQSINGYDNRILANEGAQALAAQLGLAPAQLAAYQTYSPQYAQTDLNTMRNQLYGNLDVPKFLQQHPEFLQPYLEHNNDDNYLAQLVATSPYLDQTTVPWGGGLLGMNEVLTQAANKQTVAGNTALRAGNVADAGALGGTALSTLQTLNPNMYDALNRANQQAGQIGMSGYQDSLRSQYLQGPQYQQVGGQTIGTNLVNAPQQSGYQSVNAPQISGYQAVQAPSAMANTGFSAVNSPYSDAGLAVAQDRLMNSTGPSDIQTGLERIAREKLALGGSLSAEDRRNAQQSAREGWAARGLVNSNGAVAEEILNRDALSRQRENERIAQAQGIDATGFAQRQQGYQNALGLSDAARGYAGLGLQAQQSNLGAQMQGNQLATQTSLANQDSSLRAQLANQSAAQQIAQLNQGTNMQAALANQGAYQQMQQANQSAAIQAMLANQQNAYQSQLASAQLGQQAQLANQSAYAQALGQNTSLGTTLAGLDYSRGQQNYQNLLANAQLQSANQFNPFATITSAGTANSGTNPSLFGYGQANSSGALGNQSVQSMFNPFNSYASDLYNTNYNAQVATNINNANNSAARQGAIIGAIGNFAGSVMGGAGNAGSLKKLFGCIPEGERIDTPTGPKKIEEIHTGDTVTGYDGRNVTVVMKHEYAEDPTRVRFYRFTFEGGASLAVSDRHRIGGVMAMDRSAGERVVGLHLIRTVKKFGGVKRSYDLLTDDNGYCMGGVPVNSMIEEMTAAAAEVN